MIEISPVHSSNTTTPTNNQVYVAASDASRDQGWYMDSGAASHITYDMSNLSIKSNYTVYTGPEKVTVGNGQTLSISHYGKLTLPTLCE